MPFEWFTGKPGSVERERGSSGVFVVLCDVSGTMMRNRPTLKAAFSAATQRYPSARIFLFADECHEIDTRRAWAELGGLTDMARGIRTIAPLRPSRTLIISDGGDTSGGALRAAQALTGSIDALYCDTDGSAYSRGTDRRLMEDIARQGRGAFGVYDFAEGSSRLARLIIASAEARRQPQQGEQTMRRVRNGSIDIQAPDAQVHYVYEDVHIVHQRRLHHVHAPDQVIEHGAPQNLQIAVDPSQVNVHQSGRVIERHHEAPQSLLAAILFGARKPQRQAIPAPQVVDDGLLLPPPQQPQQQARPLAIAHQPAIPMEATRKKSRSWI